jgi:signal peptidase I
MRFEEILVILTLLTGLIWLANIVYRKIKKLGKATGKQQWLIETSKSFFPVLLIVLVLRSFLFEPFRIPTGSMKPTLLEGDFVLVNKFSYGVRLPVLGTTLIPISKPKTGDIVVFRHTEGKDLIKRIIGVPGDRVRYQHKQLYINDKPVPHTFKDITQDHGIYTIDSVEHLNNIVHDIYDYPQYERHYIYSDVIVPPGSYFVMGDNRSNSEDSRTWGFLSDKDLLGKAIATWLSWNSNSDSLIPIRWSRIGQSVYKYNEE